MRKVSPYTFAVQRAVCYASSSSRRENAPAAGRALRCDIGLDLGLVLAVTAPKSISHRSLLDQTNQALAIWTFQRPEFVIPCRRLNADEPSVQTTYQRAVAGSEKTGSP